MRGKRRTGFFVRTVEVLFGVLFLAAASAQGEDGSRLWLRYEPISNMEIRAQYDKLASEIVIDRSEPTLAAAAEELQRGLVGLLGREIPIADSARQAGAIAAGTPRSCPLVKSLLEEADLKQAGDEGYLLRSAVWNQKPITLIAANQPRGVLYGSFHLLRLMQTHQPIDRLAVQEKPKIQRRLLNHWDNLDGSVERGYAGRSIWKWEQLPEVIDPRYKDYARANASIDINGTVLNNVNAQAKILTAPYLEKTAAIANVLRPYGLRVYLSVKFTSPMEIGGLSTCDPLEPAVRRWWKEKMEEIYRLIPDFGGVLVKAYSEGQPGPQMYGRTHADGANMLAEAAAPYGGIVMWRSFVYDLSIDSDRAKCAYLEFVPLDGQFAKNVMIQTKNGPIDFQPREPFNPLFGAMAKTPLLLELQITQEYTGQANYLVYLGPQWKEVLDSDTYARGPGSTVGRIVDSSVFGHSLTGIAGVSGIGSDVNWTGHPFSQANWYAFGRLGWNHTLSAETLAEEWIRMTFTNDKEVVEVIGKMMAGSWEACVDTMTPLGLAHLMAEGHHYGPAPDFVHPVRHDWSSTYYHRAEPNGIGFDRSTSGTGAVLQYFSPLREQLDNPKTCPEKYLLWFHHLPWDWRMKSGQTLWEDLQAHYHRGAAYAEWMQSAWASLEGKIDPERFEEVRRRLQIQADNARQWRDVCLEYFGRFANSIEKQKADR